MANSHGYAEIGKSATHPDVLKIGCSDVFGALVDGLEDFWEKPSHYVFLCLIYPVVGFVLISWVSTGEALQLIYPMIAGFALIGPFAALGLYEISRRRELDLDTSWRHALAVVRSPAAPSILVVGIFLMVLFLLWLYASQALYGWLYGPGTPSSFPEFIQNALSTSKGWKLVILGNVIGLGFALVVLATTSIAFPLLLDRPCGAAAAILASIRVFLTNPLPILLWGVMVAVLLVIGSLFFFFGLAIVIPVLGHATWHLYRRTTVRPIDRHDWERR